MQGSRNLPHSIMVKAMILNGFGFTHQRLYLFPNFFMAIPTEKLLGKDVIPSSLNDDVVGRTLDAIYEYGATELFNEITLHVMKQFSLGTQLILLILRTSVFMANTKMMHQMARIR
jgi:transposase